jgi:hypothetical protein
VRAQKSRLLSKLRTRNMSGVPTSQSIPLSHILEPPPAQQDVFPQAQPASQDNNQQHNGQAHSQSASGTEVESGPSNAQRSFPSQAFSFRHPACECVHDLRPVFATNDHFPYSAVERYNFPSFMDLISY